MSPRPLTQRAPTWAFWGLRGSEVRGQTGHQERGGVEAITVSSNSSRGAGGSSDGDGSPT